MRTNPQTGQRDAIPVHIKQIENQKTDDVAMKSNDILYVPDSAGKKVLARGAEAAIGVGSGRRDLSRSIVLGQVLRVLMRVTRY